MRKFKETNRKKRMLFVSEISAVLLITIVVVYRSYAIYQENQNFNVIRGSVSDYMSDYDVRLTLTIDGVESSDFPSRDSGKVFESAECDKGATGVWDYERWSPLVLNTTKTRTKCKYHFVSKYSDSILNGADPVLADGLIPVTIDDSGVVKKASLGSEWYNYRNKIWANAVILENPSTVYTEGEIIPENNIESYFVWIPRYKYKIFNEGNYVGLMNADNRVKTIEIEFENRDTLVSNGLFGGEWMTHPAFTNFNTNGMWVGKFETGYKGANSTKEAESNTDISEKIIIKPNVYAWRNIQVANAFIASYYYQRNIESHMMKNTEWGAVAFLQHSLYGSQQSVRINNNSAYITGYAARVESDCGYTATNADCNKYESTALGVDGTYTVNYNNNASVVASTTGNRSGVYDMSGGSWEYMMGVMVDKSGNPASGRHDAWNSNFIGSLTYLVDANDKNKATWTSEDGGLSFPEEEYYDKYAYGEDYEHYNRRILGDATGEIGPFYNVTYETQTKRVSSWYQDEASFVAFNGPWFMRGGSYERGMASGIFSFLLECGRVRVDIGFRVVLSK